MFIRYFAGDDGGDFESRHLDNCSIRGHLDASPSPLANSVSIVSLQRRRRRRKAERVARVSLERQRTLCMDRKEAPYRKINMHESRRLVDGCNDDEDDDVVVE